MLSLCKSDISKSTAGRLGRWMTEIQIRQRTNDSPPMEQEMNDETFISADLISPIKDKVITHNLPFKEKKLFIT